MSYKKAILRLTPKFVHEFVRDIYFIIRLIPNYLYDFWRFLKYSGLNKNRGYQAERAARITLFYHQVEKGLSLAEPRPGFGMQVIPRLLDDIDSYILTYGLAPPATTAMAALHSYVAFNTRMGHDTSYVRDRLSAIAKNNQIPPDANLNWVGGTLQVTRADLTTSRTRSFADFFESRFSIRNFSGGDVPGDDIRKAVALAQKSPSVCNRQSWRVHSFKAGPKMLELLAIQSGNRGFAEQVSNVLIVTTEMASFIDVGERYQSWIDGGMFAMSLCLAFHDLGYGTCCLNWSKEHKTDRALRAASGIPESEQVIMLIAVGTLPESFAVARSYRPPVEHCLRLH